MNILDAIGKTPLVELKEVVPSNSARVLAKLEWANPTGSMKDRMARAAIESAEQELLEFLLLLYVLRKDIKSRSFFPMHSVLKRSK
jgi:threonine synthase